MIIACGHTLWGLLAYRRTLKKVLRGGLVDSIGDPVFRTAHDRRAESFWFLFAGPLTALTGYLTDAALEAEDDRAVMLSGATALALGAVGTTVMPRSGFPGLAAVGWWAIQRGRDLQRAQTGRRLTSCAAGAVESRPAALQANP